MVRGVIALVGNIGSGKTTLMGYFATRRGQTQLRRLLKPGETIHLRPETAHKTHLRELFYLDLKRGTNRYAGLFEIAAVVDRLGIARELYELKGIGITDRPIIEGRAIFAENSFRTLGKDGKRLMRQGKLGIYDMLMRDTFDEEDTVTEDIIIYHQVTDPKILYERVKKRVTDTKAGEVVPLEYLKAINEAGYERHFSNQQAVNELYDHYGRPRPRLVIVNASRDIFETPEHLEDVTREIVATAIPILRRNSNGS